MSLLLERYNIALSKNSVWRAVRQAGLRARKRQRRPFLTDINKTRRLAFASKYRKQNWRTVLFSDEKTFELFASSHNQYIWTATSDGVPALPTVKHPPKLHVWGGISFYGKTELYVFTGTMDSKFYKGILKERLLSDANSMFGGRSWTFQQDGDPKHTSRRVQGWLEQNVRFIPKRDWPPNSPDLNPIENLWAYLQRQVYAREPRTMSQLQRVIEEEWTNIPVEMVQRLVNSMQRRLAAVIFNKGGHTSF